jgi:hypothetical protein
MAVVKDRFMFRRSLQALILAAALAAPAAAAPDRVWPDIAEATAADLHGYRIYKPDIAPQGAGVRVQGRVCRLAAWADVAPLQQVRLEHRDAAGRLLDQAAAAVRSDPQASNCVRYDQAMAWTLSPFDTVGVAGL